MEKLTPELIDHIMQLGVKTAEPRQGPNGETLLPAYEPGGTFKYTAMRSDQPKQIEENPIFHGADSFCEYVDEFKDQGEAVSQLFADVENCRFVCALDYHSPNKAIRRTHNAHFAPKLSDEWKAWDEHCGHWHRQDEMAHFIQEHAHHFLDPDGATMLECATDLNMSGNVTVKSKPNLQSGQVSIQVTEEGEAKTSTNIRIPEKVTVELPIFFTEQPQRIGLFFRYRARPGDPIAFKLDIHQRDKVLNDAFLAIVSRIGESSGIVPKLGVPNSGAVSRL